MPASLSLPPRLTQDDFIALASEPMTWQARFYLAGLLTLAACPVVYVSVIADAAAAGLWGL